MIGSSFEECIGEISATPAMKCVAAVRVLAYMVARLTPLMTMFAFGRTQFGGREKVFTSCD
jgi:hypothetical protein